MARPKGTVTLVHERTGAHWTCPHDPGLLRVVARSGWQPKRDTRRRRKTADTAVETTSASPATEPADTDPTGEET